MKIISITNEEMDIAPLDHIGIIPDVPVVRHFKGKFYIVLDSALHSETKERYTVYRALYGDEQLYVRPSEMFESDVDREKYPDVKQKKRFTNIDSPDLNLYKSSYIVPDDISKEVFEEELFSILSSKTTGDIVRFTNKHDNADLMLRILTLKPDTTKYEILYQSKCVSILIK